ncbi:MAG: GNAT family N-acetyltransferase [Kofleriaceae bacterium]
MNRSLIELPDEPRWVEAHGLATEPATWRRALGDGFVIGNDDALLGVIAGRADPAAVIALSREVTHATLLTASDELAAALRESGRHVDRAILHTLPDPSSLPDLDGASLLPDDVPLDHVWGPLADELAYVRGRRPVWAAYVEGVPVSFAYAPWRSGHWFDVSIDTLPSARQLGLATIVAAALIRDERAHGREPVWGADESNHASLRLAERLGFVPVDELWVAMP